MDSLALAATFLVIGLLGPRALYLYAAYLAVAPDAKDRRLTALRGLAVGIQIGTIVGTLRVFVPFTPYLVAAAVLGAIAGPLIASRMKVRARDYLPDYMISMILVSLLAQTIIRTALDI